MEDKQPSNEIDPTKFAQLINAYKELADSNDGNIPRQQIDEYTSADVSLTPGGTTTSDDPEAETDINDLVDVLHIQIIDRLLSGSEVTTVYKIELLSDQPTPEAVKKSYFYQNQAVREWYQANLGPEEDTETPTHISAMIFDEESEYPNPDFLAKHGAPPEILEAAQELSIRAQQDATSRKLDTADVQKLEIILEHLQAA